MDDLIKKIAVDVEKIREEQVELIKQGAVHNHLLREHEARSIALQNQVALNEKELDLRLTPIEDHVKGVNIVFKIIGVLAGGISVTYYAVLLFSKLFH